jgi:hypothetical protein
MMGIKDRTFSVLPRNISLEELVPKENSYGHYDLPAHDRGSRRRGQLCSEGHRGQPASPRYAVVLHHRQEVRQSP